jgi:hypothetical protein
MKRKIASLIFGSVVLAMSACGGGGSDENSGSSTSSTTPAASINLTGTVATGKAISGASVTVKDSKGASKTATADANGQYTIDVAGMTAPFIAKAEGKDAKGAAVTYYGMVQVLPDSRVINLTPLTDSIVRAVGNPATIFANSATELLKSDYFAKLSQAQANLKIALKDYIEKRGGSVTSDLTTTAFAANQQSPIDSLLDCLSYDASTGKISIKQNYLPAGATADKLAFNPATDATASALPATVTAPATTNLDFLVKNLPLIEGVMQQFNDAANTDKGADNLRSVLNVLFADTFADEDFFGVPVAKAAFIDSWVKDYSSSDKFRVAMYPLNVVNYDVTAKTLELCERDVETIKGTSTTSRSGSSFKFNGTSWQFVKNTAAVKAACPNY